MVIYTHKEKKKNSIMLLLSSKRTPQWNKKQKTKPKENDVTQLYIMIMATKQDFFFVFVLLKSGILTCV